MVEEQEAEVAGIPDQLGCSRLRVAALVMQPLTPVPVVTIRLTVCLVITQHRC